MAHRHPISETEVSHRRAEKIHATELGLDQDPPPPRSSEGRRQGRQATPATQVENDAGAFAQQLGKGPGVTELALEHSRTDPSAASCVGEDPAEFAQRITPAR